MLSYTKQIEPEQESPMKFSYGYWTMKPGNRPFYAAQVHDVKVEPAALTLFAPTKKLAARGEMLDIPMLTLRISSPMPDVVRVQVVHHAGGLPPKPAFELGEVDGFQPVISETEHEAVFRSGNLSLHAAIGDDWKFEFRADGRLLTQSGWRSLGYVDTPEGRFIHEQLGIGVGESIYGLGERFTPFVKNGQVVDLWNEDGGTSSEIAYKNIPFYLSSRGYGVFINHPEQVSLEIASERIERVQFSVPGEALDYFVIYGPTPKEVLRRYTALTGRPALPPPWSFGLWLSTSFTTNYDEATVSQFIDGMSERSIPLSVFHFDCFWMREFNWCDFEWDTRCFPDPQSMLKRLKERGLHICVWINPYIAQRSPLFEEGVRQGYLIRRMDGSAWQTDTWQPGMGIVDFTNPAAREWYSSKLHRLMEMGVDCFKTDFGERIPTDVVYHDGSCPLRMHNYFSFLYNRTVFEALQSYRGEKDAVVFARSATSGGQQFPVHWGGDCTATFVSMAESLRGGLSLGLSGFGFWSHDIGGFEQKANAEVYKRWCAFGLLSSHSRLHGASSYRVPWLFDEEAVDVLRYFTRLKMSLMPYLYRAAVQAHKSGAPVLRAMLLEFPDDPACDTLDRQYMLGDDLLVAPVFSGDGNVDYYVPAGRWTNILDGNVVVGPRWVREQHGVMSLPLLARPNSIIPTGSRNDTPDYEYAEGVRLQIYELEEGKTATCEVPDRIGNTRAVFTASLEGKTITIRVEGEAKDWSALLVGVHGAQALEGCQVENGDRGPLIYPEGLRVAVLRLGIL
jgi:alpha-D-xyloside xylohydrolase